MIAENYAAYADGGTHKEFNITVQGTSTVITNDKLLQDSIRLEEALCSDDNLRFGACEASQLTLQTVYSGVNFTGKVLYVSVTMDGSTVKYGAFKVKSDTPTADRLWRVLTCYDAMYDIQNTDVSEWYNSLAFPMTIRAFRNSFFTYLGITQKSTTLINDDFEIDKGFTVAGSLSGKTIIEAICEFNGVFGHINRNDQFEYVSLSDAGFDCPPYENGAVQYEDYITDKITKVTMTGSKTDIGTSAGTDGNEYIIVANPLIYGKEGTPALVSAITNLLNKIKDIQYRPYTVSKTIGNPCVELGDRITIESKYQTVKSYVIKRTLTGIQALRDRYSSSGDKTYPVVQNSISGEIQRVLGKTNELERTVDGTVSKVTELEETVDGYSESISTLEQDAKKFVLSVDSNGKVAMMKLENAPGSSSNFEVVADNINLDGYNIKLNGTEGITITSPNFSVTKQGIVNMTGANVSGDITANTLTLGVNASVPSGKVTGLAAVATSGNYNDLSGKPTIPSTELFVQKDGTIGHTPSEGATGFVVSSEGLLQASNAVIYGTTYSSAGKIGGITIANNGISAGDCDFSPYDIYNGYTRYKSGMQSYHHDYGISRARITFSGYTTFVVVIRSEAEGNYDYTIAGQLDAQNITRDSATQGTTKGNQKTDVTVTYSCSTSQHTIEILYTKDQSQHTEPDCGFFYVDEAACVGNTNRSFSVEQGAFSLSSDGGLVATGARISGNITADSLTLGANVMIPASKVEGLPDVSVYVQKDGTIGSEPAEGATGFVVSSAGLLKASNAVIYGTIYASAGLIGGVTIGQNSIHAGVDGDFSVYDTYNGYTRYKSGAQSYHVPNGLSRARIDFSGYTKFTVVIRSDGESTYDYTVAGLIDTQDITRTGSNQGSTKGNQKSDVSVTYNCTTSSHFIEIIYAKDGSQDVGEDCGWFYVDESQCSGNSGRSYTVGTGYFSLGSDGVLRAKGVELDRAKTGTGTQFVELSSGDITMGVDSKIKAVISTSPYALTNVISYSYLGTESLIPKSQITIGDVSYAKIIELTTNNYNNSGNSTEINLKGTVHMLGYYMGRKSTSVSSGTVDSTARSIASITLPVKGTYIVTGILHTSASGNLQAGVGTSSGSGSITARADNSDWLTVTRVIEVTSSTTVYLVGRCSTSTTAASGTLIEYVKVN